MTTKKTRAETKPKLRTYEVVMPITAYVAVTVKAADVESAKTAACDIMGDLRMCFVDVFDDTKLSPDVEVGEWSTHEQIVGGNVFHGVMNEINIDEIDSEDE